MRIERYVPTVEEAQAQYGVAMRNQQWCSGHCSTLSYYPGKWCQRTERRVDAASLAYDLAVAAAHDARSRG